VIWDAYPADSCIPIPASEVQGAYAGRWEGLIRCPEPMALGGEVRFDLAPTAAPDSFTVEGRMGGRADDPGWITFHGEVAGTMGCAGLSATLRISVGGDGPPLPLTGEMAGSFTPSPQSFRNGSWTVRDPSEGYCSGSGTWSAGIQR
jgi:hypothetical protein